MGRFHLHKAASDLVEDPVQRVISIFVSEVFVQQCQSALPKEKGALPEPVNQAHSHAKVF